jgi:GT2 family glycosyltransferase
VAFIDSDCVADAHWIERGLAAARQIPNLGVVAGRVDLVSPNGSSDAGPAVLYEKMFAFDQVQNASQGTSVTANWLSPKAVIDRFGGFDATLKAGADTKLSREISQAGFKVVYCPDMLVYHPARASVGELVKKRRRVVGGKWQVASHSPRAVAKLALAITRDGLGRIAKAMGKSGMRLKERLQVAGVAALILAVGIGELLLLMLGSQPRRS